MRYAQPSELTEAVVPVLQLRLSEREFDELFPVRTVDLDPLAAAEPSRGALIRLDAGSYVVVTYGKITHRALVEVPGSADAPDVVRELFSEVEVPSSAIEWTGVNVQPPVRRGRRTKKAGAKPAAKTLKKGT